MSLEELEATFEHELLTDKWAAAETAYALACRHRTESGERDRRSFGAAKEWAVCAINILDDLPAEYLAQVTTTRTSVGGIDLPDPLRPGVVRERLADVLRQG